MRQTECLRLFSASPIFEDVFKYLGTKIGIRIISTAGSIPPFSSCTLQFHHCLGPVTRALNLGSKFPFGLATKSASVKQPWGLGGKIRSEWLLSGAGGDLTFGFELNTSLHNEMGNHLSGESGSICFKHISDGTISGSPRKKRRRRNKADQITAAWFTGVSKTRQDPQAWQVSESQKNTNGT